MKGTLLKLAQTFEAHELFAWRPGLWGKTFDGVPLSFVCLDGQDECGDILIISKRTPKYLPHMPVWENEPLRCAPKPWRLPDLEHPATEGVLLDWLRELDPYAIFDFGQRRYMSGGAKGGAYYTPLRYRISFSFGPSTYPGLESCDFEGKSRIVVIVEALLAVLDAKAAEMNTTTDTTDRGETP